MPTLPGSHRRIGRIEGWAITYVANTRITNWQRLSHTKNDWRAGFERTGIGFVAGAVLVEDSITAANRGFSVSYGIPSKAETRRKIEQMPVHTSRGACPKPH